MVYTTPAESICRPCTGKYHLALVFRDSILFTIKSPARCTEGSTAEGRRRAAEDAQEGCRSVFDGGERELSFCRNKTRLSNQARPGIDGPPTIIAVMERAHLSAGRSGAARERFSYCHWLFRGFPSPRRRYPRAPTPARSICLIALKYTTDSDFFPGFFPFLPFFFCAVRLSRNRIAPIPSGDNKWLAEIGVIVRCV